MCVVVVWGELRTPNGVVYLLFIRFPFTSIASIPKQHCYGVVYVCVCVWLCWALGVVYLALLGLPFDLACLPYPVWVFPYFSTQWAILIFLCFFEIVLI